MDFPWGFEGLEGQRQAPLNMEFKTGPKTELVIVALVRFPSHKLDNMIAGRLWLDDVQVFPLS